MGEANEQLDVEGPGGFKIKARGTDIIAVIVLVTGIVGVVLLWMHMQDAKAEAASAAVVQKESNANLASVLREMNQTNKELVGVQRVTNCLISRGINDRGVSALSECERLFR